MTLAVDLFPHAIPAEQTPVSAQLGEADLAPGTTVPIRPSYLDRIVADGSDKTEWLRARSQGITATDVAKLTSPRSIRAVAQYKLYGSSFTGNAFTEYGKIREPEIAGWVQQNHGLASSQALFHAENEKRHLATPDGLGVREAGRLELVEIKTTNKPFKRIPRPYLRQVWWQQYVLGAERTLFVWEEHRNFEPLADEPQCCWIERDGQEIRQLVSLANQLIDTLYQMTRHSA